MSSCALGFLHDLFNQLCPTPRPRSHPCPSCTPSCTHLALLSSLPILSAHAARAWSLSSYGRTAHHTPPSLTPLSCTAIPHVLLFAPHVPPVVCHVRDSGPRAARRAGWAEAGAPPHPVCHARAGPAPQQAVQVGVVGVVGLGVGCFLAWCGTVSLYCKVVLLVNTSSETCLCCCCCCLSAGAGASVR